MRNLLALVGLVVVAFAGVGWYRQWYTLGVQAGTDGTQRITVDVKTKHMGQDLGAAKERVGKFLADPPAPAAADPGRPEFVGPPAPSWLKTSPTGR